MKAKRVLVAGEGVGEVICTKTPLSFWGGVDPNTGTVIDQHHELCGENLVGRVLMMPGGRGSCTSSVVLLECILSNHSPAAILLTEIDEIVALGAVLACELFAKRIPILLLDEDMYDDLMSADRIEVFLDGNLSIGENVNPLN